MFVTGVPGSWLGWVVLLLVGRAVRALGVVKVVGVRERKHGSGMLGGQRHHCSRPK